MNERLHGIDAFRLLAAFGVVSLHVSGYRALDADVAALIRLSARWAVPFFFMVTGYFLAQKNGPSRAVNSLARAGVIFLIATVIMLPLMIREKGLRDAFLWMLSDGFLMRGSYYHLWFLGSMVVGLLVILLLDQFDMPEMLSRISAVLTLFFLLGSYHPLSEEATNLARYLAAVPFIYLGMQVSRRQLTFKVSVIAVLAGASLQIIEAWAISRARQESAFGYQFLLGTIPLCVGMFGLAKSLPDRPVTRWLAAWGARYALGIYILHPYLVYLVRARLSQETQQTVAYDSLIAPAVYILSLLAMLLLDKVAPVVVDLMAAERQAIQRLNIFARRKNTPDAICVEVSTGSVADEAGDGLSRASRRERGSSTSIVESRSTSKRKS